MINEAIVHSVVLHKVGNKTNEDGIGLSKGELTLDEEMRSVLSLFFISQFKTEEYFNLFDDSDIAFNKVYSSVSAIFENPDTLYEESVKLAKHLYEQSDHPKIKNGEFYVAYFKDCVVDGEPVNAVGLFKTENKDLFLKVYSTSNNYIIESEEGINTKKPDKGCIIFNTERENGYLASIIDGAGKGNEAAYWTDGFLHVQRRNDSYNKTEKIMQVCKKFVEEQLPQNFQIDKTDQIDILNRSMQYFKSNDIFEMPAFEETVLQQPELIESFRDFDQTYCAQNDIPVEMTFEIEPQAVKKQARIFKSVLKLDKNFHIYIHGDRSKIERCEEDGVKFYKIYYDNEN